MAKPRNRVNDGFRAALLAEAQEGYHRLNSHAGDAFECMVCRSKDFSGYITHAEWADGPIVDVAKIYREALGA